MKKIHIKNTTRKLAGILTVFVFLLSSAACNQSGDAKTDYVNEIEAAENAVGDPILENANDEPGEPQEIAPADVETEQDTAVVDDDRTIQGEEEVVE